MAHLQDKNICIWVHVACQSIANYSVQLLPIDLWLIIAQLKYKVFINKKLYI